MLLMEHRIHSEYAYALNENEIVLKLKIPVEKAKNVFLRYVDKYKYLRKSYKPISEDMIMTLSDNQWSYYECVIPFDALNITYFFQIEMKNGDVIYYGNDTFFTSMINDISSMYHFATLSDADINQVPAWASNAVIYQIFPDRFYKSDLDTSWYKKVNGKTFLGGNLKGITLKLDYLKNLGINCIYLTPIFKASTNHRYNIEDYYEIDPLLGTKDDFKKLVERAHQLGIRIIIDIVFNHCGTSFFAFQDVLEKQEKSPYASWFYIHEYPVDEHQREPNYKTFGYFSGMPKLNLDQKEARAYFIKVAEYWVENFEIDGVRLDVADEVSHDFWRDFRKALKGINPEILIVGEVWYNATAWLKGDEFDTVMHYESFRAIHQWIASKSIDAKGFADEIEKALSPYMKQSREVLWNLVGTHDTERFKHAVGECPQKLFLGLALITFLPGVPMFYYGDEVGLTGGHDPDNRRGMLWEEIKIDSHLLNRLKSILKFYHEHETLRSGDYRRIHTEADVFIFERYNKKESIMIAFNASSEPQSIFLNHLNEYLEIPPYEIVIKK